MTKLKYTYCRYCAFCHDIHNDLYHCSLHGYVMDEKHIKRAMLCDKYAECDLGDVITGRQYHPREKKPKKPTQLSMFTSEVSHMSAPEYQEQRNVFEIAERLKGIYPEVVLLFHIPNGGRRDTAEAANLKKQGVKPGVPDLFLPVARGGYHGLFIEMKRRDGGRLSEHQKHWLHLLEHQGYAAVVCHGAENAVDTIISYLKLKRG